MVRRRTDMTYLAQLQQPTKRNESLAPQPETLVADKAVDVGAYRPSATAEGQLLAVAVGHRSPDFRFVQPVRVG